MRSVLFALTLMILTTGDALATPRSVPARINLHIAQVSRAEERCVDAVRRAGYRVNGILSTSTFSGGAEIIMEVRDRRENFVVGCDYAENTGDTELYRLETSSYRSNRRYSERYDGRHTDPYSDPYSDPYYSSPDDWRNDRYQGRYDDPYSDPYNTPYPTDYPSTDNWQERFYTASGVRDETYAEQIARAVVGDQLGLENPYSDIVRIDLVRRESRDRNWIVEGRVNGAPFAVRIRSNDAYILGFDLY
jgi:hypothetical protein